MFKLVVLCALCICVCAFTSETFSPYTDPAFHFTRYNADGSVFSASVVHSDGLLFYSREVYSNGVDALVRCDIISSRKCFYKNTISGQVFCGYENNEYLDSVLTTEFDYVKSTATTCPDGVSTRCMNFTNIRGDTLTVDSRKRVVMYAASNMGGIEVTRYTYHDDVPTVATFADVDCDGNALADPVPFGSVPIKDLGCAFSFTVTDEEGSEDIRGFKDENGVQFLLMNCTGYQLLIRRDVDDCYGEQYAENYGVCSSNLPPSADYILGCFLPQGEFGYIGVPESVSCSEGGPAECVKYTSATGHYIIVDSQNRVVVDAMPNEMRDFRVTFFEYHDEEPSIDIFNNLMCNTTALPPAKFTCPSPPPSSSSTKPVDPSSSTKPVDPSSSTKPVDPSSKTSGSQTVSSSSFVKATTSLIVSAIIVALF